MIELQIKEPRQKLLLEDRVQRKSVGDKFNKRLNLLNAMTYTIQYQRKIKTLSNEIYWFINQKNKSPSYSQIDLVQAYFIELINFD